MTFEDFFCRHLCEFRGEGTKTTATHTILTNPLHCFQVMARGDRRKEIFRDERDRWKFLGSPRFQPGKVRRDALLTADTDLPAAVSKASRLTLFRKLTVPVCPQESVSLEVRDEGRGKTEFHVADDCYGEDENVEDLTQTSLDP
jgi:hypothetical protein